jgi:metal-dependent amidase/aminoacylase/carboxypeptidase family protein
MILPVMMLATVPPVAEDPLGRIEAEARKVTPDMIELRHSIHQNPELSNRQEKTADPIADYLRKLGLDVQ